MDLGNKQQLFPYTLTDWSVQPRRYVYCAVRTGSLNTILLNPRQLTICMNKLTWKLSEVIIVIIVISPVTKIPFKLYSTYQFSDNEQIKTLGQLQTIYDKYNPLYPLHSSHVRL